MSIFKPGLHIIAKLTNCNPTKISSCVAVKNIIDTFIDDNKLINLGEVYHQFENAGYTALVCLSESHISIHTWPEFDIVNFDIYLSNHQRSNEGIVEQFFNILVNYFEAIVIEKQAITR